MGLIFSTLLRFPLWVWLVAALGAWGTYSNWQVNRHEKARAEAAAETQRIVSMAESRKNEAARKVSDANIARIKSLSRDVSKLRSDNERLQFTIAADSSVPRDAATVCGVDGERGRALESLLVEGAGLAAEGAENVARLGNKTTALQEFIRSVCLIK